MAYKRVLLKLSGEALANKELANIEIIGYKALKTGNNEITIKATIKNEAAEIVEEKIYKISVKFHIKLAY